MPLTPEDVVSKRFNSTKFREGYDQDEVDDFLDEVVVELRRLNAENDELRQRLVASEARINELQSGGAQGGEAAYSAPVAAVVAETPAPEPEPVVEPEPEAAPEPVAAEPVAAAPDAVITPTGPDPDSSTNDLLKLARRLHDQHVQEGVDKRDSLIAEGHSTASRLVSDAQEQTRVQLGRLEEQKSSLESSIDQLRSFESEYRSRLKSYIEGQLSELNSSADSVAPANGVPAGASAAASGTVSPPQGSNAPTAFAAAAPAAPASQPAADRSGVSGTA